MRLIPTYAALLSSTILSLHAEPVTRRVWQPVQEYFIHTQPGKAQVMVQGTKRLNSFVAYSHLGTDFGFHGPAEHTIQWETDEICAYLGQEPDAWAGVWHSLSGLAREPGKTLNFAAVWPDCISRRYQPRATAVMLAAKGRGRVKLEIKSPDQKTLWSQSVEMKSTVQEPVAYPVSAAELPNAKLISWTAEPGSEVCITGLRLGIEAPAVPFDEYVLAASYAKLARCYDEQAGMVKDRAHIEDGAFESVPSTGMFVLATAAVAQAPLGIVSKEYAQRILRQVHDSMTAMKRPGGLLPHFVRRTGGINEIHRGTEYSTVDTSIYYHSLLLAARLLGDDDMHEKLAGEIRQIRFDDLRLSGGYLSHGMKDDGHTLLPHGWSDWGGETALVMLLERMVRDNPPRLIMKRPGQAWQGSGFITEIQSLFYPDFDSDKPDALDGVKWLSVRRAMLGAQRTYIQRTWPQSSAAKMGLYGLSAGEGEHGDRYSVGGTDLPDQALIHPHYILMSGTVAEKPEEVYTLLQHMEKADLFPPWGLVENVTVDESSYLPMDGSLNAAFEALGAYHLLAKSRGITDVIYDANLHTPETRRAIQMFYPNKVSTAKVPVQTAKLEIR